MTVVEYDNVSANEISEDDSPDEQVENERSDEQVEKHNAN